MRFGKRKCHKSSLNNHVCNDLLSNVSRNKERSSVNQMFCELKLLCPCNERHAYSEPVVQADHLTPLMNNLRIGLLIVLTATSGYRQGIADSQESAPAVSILLSSTAPEALIIRPCRALKPGPWMPKTRERRY